MPKFVFVKNMESFKEEEQRSNVVFLGGTGKIYTHGEYFGGEDTEIETATEEDIEKALIEVGLLDGPKIDSISDTFSDIEISESNQGSRVLKGEITVTGENLKYLSKEDLKVTMRNGVGSEVGRIEFDEDPDISDNTINIKSSFYYDVPPPQNFDDPDETLSIHLECLGFQGVNASSGRQVKVIPTDRVDLEEELLSYGQLVDLGSVLIQDTLGNLEEVDSFSLCVPSWSEETLNYYNERISGNWYFGISLPENSTLLLASESVNMESAFVKYRLPSTITVSHSSLPFENEDTKGWIFGLSTYVIPEVEKPIIYTGEGMLIEIRVGYSKVRIPVERVVVAPVTKEKVESLFGAATSLSGNLKKMISTK